MEPPVQHNGKKYLFGSQSPLLPVFLLGHKPPVRSETCGGCLCRWHRSRRGEGARGVPVVLGAGTELLLLLLLNWEPCFGGSAGRLAPSNSVTIRASRAHERSFQPIIFHSDPFFFLVYLLTYGQRSIPFSLCYSVKHLSLSILLGFIPLNFNVWGSGSWRCCSEGREVHLKEKGMLPYLFSDLLYRFLKRTNNNHHP